MKRSLMVVGVLLWQQMALAEDLDAVWRHMAVPESVTTSMQKLQAIAKQPARSEFRVRSKAWLRDFSWQQQTPVIQSEFAERKLRYPAPKYRMLSAKTVTQTRLGMSDFVISMSHRLHEDAPKEATVWQMEMLADMGGKHFATQAEAIYHPAMGLMATWTDHDEASMQSHVLAQQQVGRLADGSLPRRYRETSVTEYRTLFDVKPRERNAEGECTASEPYAGTRVHANIKGKAQTVQCETRQTDHEANTIDMVYLLDYQVFVPTWQNYLGGEWQWRMVAFTGT
ncbi:MAG: hypothetical protein KA221_02530 [Vitreoscilla sp.]|nr:hypothetical protein [Vitreoscilla sp.]MBP9539860.1 hypothetical protein [Vitreoscilla sp.]